MEVRARAKSVRLSPRKVRLIADTIRNLSIDQAMHVLGSTQKRAVEPVVKTLQSAIANATNNAKLEKENLIIASIMVNEAPALKRFHPSSRGRVHPYKKKGSHITIVLTEKAVTAPVKAVEEKKAGKKSDEKKTDKGGKK